MVMNYAPHALFFSLLAVSAVALVTLALRNQRRDTLQKQYRRLTKLSGQLLVMTGRQPEDAFLRLVHVEVMEKIETVRGGTPVDNDVIKTYARILRVEQEPDAFAPTFG